MLDGDNRNKDSIFLLLVEILAETVFFIHFHKLNL